MTMYHFISNSVYHDSELTKINSDKLYELVEQIEVEIFELEIRQIERRFDFIADRKYATLFFLCTIRRVSFIIRIYLI